MSRSLCSTGFPCSITIGLMPLLTKVKAANNPAGPAPMITTFLSDEFFICILANSNSFICSNFLYFFSFFTSMSMD